MTRAIGYTSYNLYNLPLLSGHWTYTYPQHTQTHPRAHAHAHTLVLISCLVVATKSPKVGKRGVPTLQECFLVNLNYVVFVSNKNVQSLHL